MKQAPVGLMSIHLSSRRSVARRSNHVEPHGTVAIARHYIKDLVYGATDGIITTFAVVAGVTGGALSHSAVLIVGAANLAADGLSMAVGNFLAIRAHESAREADDLPEEESRPWRHAAATFVAFLGSVPDNKASEITDALVTSVGREADRIVECIEHRIDGGADKPALLQRLASGVYDVRRNMEQLERWHRHYRGAGPAGR